MLRAFPGVSLTPVGFGGEGGAWKGNMVALSHSMHTFPLWFMSRHVKSYVLLSFSLALWMALISKVLVKVSPGVSQGGKHEAREEVLIQNYPRSSLFGFSISPLISSHVTRCLRCKRVPRIGVQSVQDSQYRTPISY